MSQFLICTGRSVATLLLLFVGIAPLIAQDESAAKSDDAGASSTPVSQEDFHEAFRQWKVTVADLHDLQLEYRSAGEREKVQMERRFEKLQAQGQKQLEQLVSMAEAVLDSGHKDLDALTFLSSMLQRSFKGDNHPEVLRLGDAMLKHAPDLKGLNQFIAASAYATNDFDKALHHAKLAAEESELSDPIKEFYGGAENHEHVTFMIMDAQEKWQAEAKLRAEEAAADDLPRVKLETSKGEIVLELYENQAPNTVANFITLVKKGFYDGTVFHRVLPHFMAQGGDPKGDGSGGPGYEIPDEVGRDNYRKHFGATLSMAKTALPDTGGSQFFLTFKPAPGLDGQHTVFGRVIEGYEALANLQRIDPERPNPNVQPDRIVRATVVRDRGHHYSVKKVGD